MSKQFDQDPRGLFSPDSITWKIHSDPAMAVGGIPVSYTHLTLPTNVP
jgi:uncharacterized protein (DUF2236 family)